MSIEVRINFARLTWLLLLLSLPETIALKFYIIKDLCSFPHEIKLLIKFHCFFLNGFNFLRNFGALDALGLLVGEDVSATF